MIIQKNYHRGCDRNVFSVSCSQNETLINQCFGISQEGVPNPMNGKDGIKIFLLISIFLLYLFCACYCDDTYNYNYIKNVLITVFN